MKGMALEMVIKWIILSVVALVVIGVVMFFADEIKEYVKEMFGNNKDVQTEKIVAAKFSTSQIKTYIQSCWDKTGDKYKDDVICYILKGDVSDVDVDVLQNSLGNQDLVDLVDFDPSITTTTIRFVNIGNTIYVES